MMLGLMLLLAACGGGGSAETAGGAAPAMPAAPSGLSYPAPPSWTVGTAIVPLTPTVTGSVSTWSVAPALPAGLSLDPTDGRISGTPTVAAAATSYTVSAQNAGGATTYALSVTVVRATTARLEPAGSTTIGVGQSVSLFQVLDEGGSPFPRYVDASAVTWVSSTPARVLVNANGVVTGVVEGTATLTAQYQSFTTTLSVQVSGSFLARTLPVSGQGTRRYSIYVPPQAASGAPRPLLLAMHGGGGTAMNLAATSQIVKLAQQQQFYVAFLEGTGTVPTFNGGACCGTAQSQNVDDVSYVRSAIADLQAGFNVDALRIYATGFSNGAIMSHRLACALADRVAGIAALGGGSGQFDRSRAAYFACNPNRPIPVLQIHATNDRNYPFGGGTGSGISSTDFYPIEATVADWIARNNVTATATVTRVSPSTQCSRYATPSDAARPSAPVTLCRVDPLDLYDAATQIVFGGGHSWPGGVRSASANSDVPGTDFDANAYLWAFLTAPP